MRLTRIVATALAVLTGALTSAVLIAPQPAAAATHAVSISGYAFKPATLTVTAGDTVTWTNSDQAPHDVTTTSAPVAIHGSTMTKGQSWSYTFTTPGTYAYICSIHPDMKATVIVQPAATAAPPKPSTTAAASRRTSTVVTQRGGMAMPVTQRSKTTRHGAGASHTTSPSTSATASPTTGPTPASGGGPAAPVAVAAAPAAAPAAAAASSSPVRPLRPLLIVAGIVAALATLSLLLLAARADGPGPPPR